MDRFPAPTSAQNPPKQHLSAIAFCYLFGYPENELQLDATTSSRCGVRNGSLLIQKALPIGRRGGCGRWVSKRNNLTRRAVARSTLIPLCLFFVFFCHRVDFYENA